MEIARVLGLSRIHNPGPEIAEFFIAAETPGQIVSAIISYVHHDLPFNISRYIKVSR